MMENGLGPTHLQAPNETDHRVIEEFFRQHCLSSRERLGRLDVDCWAVTRRLINFLLEVGMEGEPAPRRVRWVVRRHIPSPPSRAGNNTIFHSIKRRVARIFRRRNLCDDLTERAPLDKKSHSKKRRNTACSNSHICRSRATTNDVDNSTISHWVVEWKGFVIDATIMQFLEIDFLLDNEGVNALKSRCYNQSESMTFKSCSDIHPPWVYEMISREQQYREFARNVRKRPYFIGTEMQHPIRNCAEVVRPIIDTCRTAEG